jgi:hypothetical protein
MATGRNKPGRPHHSLPTAVSPLHHGERHCWQGRYWVSLSESPEAVTSKLGWLSTLARTQGTLGTQQRKDRASQASLLQDENIEVTKLEVLYKLCLPILFQNFMTEINPQEKSTKLKHTVDTDDQQPSSVGSASFRETPQQGSSALEPSGSIHKYRHSRDWGAKTGFSNHPAQVWPLGSPGRPRVHRQ